ncbi:SIR2 family protein [Candidatus Endomicrobiellum agilis]|uniref:SIR2 family protein n=1 Tax=Candidatus Endomicrobiellum agilis TaxID=3238957 RepID=UPI003589CDD9|nr:SIR2 family protein [Endomicrobium sp.]
MPKKTDKKSTDKYLLISNGYSIHYDETDCFENDIKLDEQKMGTRKSKDVAEELKKKFYDGFLKKHYENLIILTGAGTSLDNGTDKNKRGKTKTQLWDECQTEIDTFESKISGFKNKSFYTEKDIEECLSYILLYEKLNGTIQNDKKDNLIEILEKKIASCCNLELQNAAPHKNFISKIIARKPNDSRVKLFTTNYDTLFEQSANNAGIVLIDGFSFSQPRQFSGKWFDLDIVNRERTRLKEEESFISEVLHLYKLHGSLDWVKHGEKIIQQTNHENNPLIIYPANEKYESSYNQPYFEMMSRFQQSLRQPNTLLIVVGFSFQDKHIKNVIFEAVEQNPSFQLLIVNFNNNQSIDTIGTLKDFFDSVENKKIKRRVSIVFDSFSDFTKNYPENEVYRKNEEVVNEQSF